MSESRVAKGWAENGGRSRQVWGTLRTTRAGIAGGFTGPQIAVLSDLWSTYLSRSGSR